MKPAVSHRCALCGRTVPCREKTNARTGAVALFPLLHSNHSGKQCRGYAVAIRPNPAPADGIPEPEGERTTPRIPCIAPQPATNGHRGVSSSGPEIDAAVLALRMKGLTPSIESIGEGEFSRCLVSFADIRGAVRFSVGGKTIIGCLDRGLVLAAKAERWG